MARRANAARRIISPPQGEPNWQPERPSWVDRAIVLGVALAATLAGLIAVAAMYGSGVPDVAAFVTWPLAVVIAALAANLSWAAIRLWIHGDLRPMQRRSLWTRHAGLIVAAAALGALGAAWVGRVTLGPLELLRISAPEGPMGEPPVWDAVGRMATVAGTGLAAAVFGLFGWLALTPRLLTDEEAQRRIADFFGQARHYLALASDTGVGHERKGGP